MGDVVSSHLDEGKRGIITARTDEVLEEFSQLYKTQYSVALFNKVRFDIEGGGGPQPQLLHRKDPLKNKSIFSGTTFYVEEKKWRRRMLLIPDTYTIDIFESKSSLDRGSAPKGSISCAGYKVLTSMDEYMELVNASLPDVKAKVGSSPFLRCATQFALILWHPYARHQYFSVETEKEQQKWNAVFQDCVRHTNNGLSEECKVQTPAFTDAVRLFRQARGQYGTWDMMCGSPTQILANLVMEKLVPELRDLIGPRLKGKLHERQRTWILISDAVYELVLAQVRARYEAMVEHCEAGRPLQEGTVRTDMDQIITSKEHVTNKIRALVLPKAEKLLKVSIQPYISSILEALMEPTSRGFFEVRDVFFRELVDMSKNMVNDGSKEKLGEHMEKISMLAFHPVKMQSCYEKVEELSLEGLQQRFDVSSPSVFVQRAQILMREQMDDAVYTFEQLLHQSLEAQEGEDVCKAIQRCQERVIKKYDYDSSTVRKRFFREALLQIFIPYMLKQLSPTCSTELPRFRELIFEDFSRYILVENIFEEVVLHTVMKDIMMAVKEAAVQRRHNLYRDSIVLTNSDPNLLLLGQSSPIDWAEQYGQGTEGEGEDGTEADGDDGSEPEAHKRRRMRQVVSMIQVEGTSIPNESCLEVPGVEDIPEEAENDAESPPSAESGDKVPNGATAGQLPKAPGVTEEQPALTNGAPLNAKESTTPNDQSAPNTEPQEEVSPKESGLDVANKSAIESAIQEIENAVQDEESQKHVETDSKNSAPEGKSEVETPNVEGQVEASCDTEKQQEAVPLDQTKVAESLSKEEEPSVVPAQEEEMSPPPSQPAEEKQTAETETSSNSPSDVEQPTIDSVDTHNEASSNTENQQEAASLDQTEVAESLSKEGQPSAVPAKEEETSPPPSQPVEQNSAADSKTSSNSPSDLEQPTTDSVDVHNDDSGFQSPSSEEGHQPDPVPSEPNECQKDSENEGAQTANVA